MTAADLRSEAVACRETCTNCGEYSAAFWVAAIILDRLADRLDAAETAASEADHGNAG